MTNLEFEKLRKIDFHKIFMKILCKISYSHN